MNIWISVLSFIATHLSFVKMFDIYGEICSGLCVCEEREGALTANCENRGLLSLSDVRPLHFNSYHLLLTGNLLKKLSLNDFVHYEGLTILHLGNNDIAEIENGAFNGLQGLKRLHLNNNRIEVLNDDTFVGLDSLEYLQIDYNYISHIEANVLNRLYHLEVLILNDNLLSALPKNIFQFVPLTHLDLRGNQLKMLAYTGLLEHMGNIVELQLEENPWNCSCELIALKAWLESISYTALVGDVVCETPFRLHGRDLDEISKQELCPRRAIAAYEIQAEPAHNTHSLLRTTSASATGTLPASTHQPTKSSHQSGTLRAKPTPRVSSSWPQNFGPAVGFQTKSPVPLDCPHACTCNLQISDLGLNVNCQERKIERISDLNPKPYNPKKMYLTGNDITSVHVSDFEEATSLDLLHLGNNRIATIHSRAFMKLTHLRRLYLNGNLIERLTDDMFCGLESLQFLYLEYNIIREIDVGTFEQLPNLQLLFLNNNLLKVLPVGLFRGLRLARLNLRNNHFRNLPVSGVLEDLQSLVQIDLFENPWDCSCAVLEMKNWLEQLSAGTVVNSVVCESPLKLSGEDMRYVHSSRFCPDTSHVQTSIVPPSEASFPGSTITLETTPDYDAQYPTVPLSVLILTLLLLFIMTVFIAAGLFAVTMKRRHKAQLSASLQASGTSFTTLYRDKTAPKIRTSAGHVYEYIPPPAQGTSRSATYGLAHGAAGGACRDLDELNGVLVSNSDEEGGSIAVGSVLGAGTPHPLHRVSHLQDNGCFYQHFLAGDQHASYRASLPCKHGGRVSGHYAPDCDVQLSYLHPERMQQTVTYCARPASVSVEPNRSEYWELNAKLHFEPDYLEVHEKRTFTQF
ncbi:SLIT and NTRK-like protein 5 [Brachyhypopomus gauderio]|uniref:SLIT and NTRK-like protein 5 n=1 Tax=Brachyhypopomus gauderio TaxID=698409 RepID=UPI0040417372